MADTVRKVVIGTRGSALALAQTDIAAQALKAVDPTLEIEIKVITTQGDVNLGPIPMDTVGKGWFTKEIEEGLLDGSIDIAVHSLKDMGQELPSGLSIGAYLKREDPRDALITKTGALLKELPVGAVVGTDSTRRQTQMRALRPDTVMKSIRGNVLKRLEKLETEPYDAIILAAAGLKRLNLEEKVAHYFEPGEMTCAPGQGILALEARADNLPLQKILSQINDNDARQSAIIERSFSEKTGSGCKSPTGAYAFRQNDGYRLIGMLSAEDGSVVRDELYAPLHEIGKLGEALAKKMLQQLNGHA